jgi:hypothetical protein
MMSKTKTVVLSDKVKVIDNIVYVNNEVYGDFVRLVKGGVLVKFNWGNIILEY